VTVALSPGRPKRVLNGGDGYNEWAQQLDDFQIGVLDPEDVKRVDQLRQYPAFFDTSPGGSTRASTGARVASIPALSNPLRTCEQQPSTPPALHRLGFPGCGCGLRTVVETMWQGQSRIVSGDTASTDVVDGDVRSHCDLLAYGRMLHCC
jgi:hypothetical protein